MLDSAQLTGIAFFASIAFVTTLISTPIIAKMMRRRGITGKDVHKISKIEIPEMCGLAILLGLTLGSLAYVVAVPSSGNAITAFLATVLIAGAIGFFDDLRPLSARVKPLLTAFAALPIIFLHAYSPYPTIPLLGTVRLTIVYPFLILIAIAVTSNSVNMMDVMNGSMPGTVSITSATITVVLLISGEMQIAAISAGVLAASLAFFYYNRFPAKVFSGDTGSLAVGAALGAIAILGKVETVMVVALIPQIMNAFYGLSSVGRLYERREIQQRPTRLLSDGTLEASDEKHAPVTLARLILAAGPATEGGVVRSMMILTAVSSTLAFLTYWIGVGIKP
jgi:UDP-N-acetylglucosamine--dolichyl-phosphate N-acetylglucosaminephosphotransferase